MYIIMVGGIKNIVSVVLSYSCYMSFFSTFSHASCLQLSSFLVSRQANSTNLFVKSKQYLFTLVFYFFRTMVSLSMGHMFLVAGAYVSSSVERERLSPSSHECMHACMPIIHITCKACMHIIRYIHTQRTKYTSKFPFVSFQNTPSRERHVFSLSRNRTEIWMCS